MTMRVERASAENVRLRLRQLAAKKRAGEGVAIDVVDIETRLKELRELEENRKQRRKEKKRKRNQARETDAAYEQFSLKEGHLDSVKQRNSSIT